MEENLENYYQQWIVIPRGTLWGVFVGMSLNFKKFVRQFHKNKIIKMTNDTVTSKLSLLC
jgi:hypothetical protein